MAEERLVEDQKLGMQPAPEHPDVVKLAEDLMGRGFTVQEVEDAAGRLPVNETALNRLIEQFEPQDNILTPTQEFTGMLDVSESKFMNEKTVEETSTAQAIAENGIAGDLEAQAEVFKAENRGSGVPNVEGLREANVTASKQAFFGLEGDPVGNLEAVKEDAELEIIKPDILVLYEGAVERLREQGVSEKALGLITVSSAMFERRQLEDILTAGIDEQFKNSGLGELALDFSEVFTDIFGVSDRMQRRQIVDTVSGDSSSLTDYNFYRSDDIRDIVENGFDTLSFKEQREFLHSLIEASSNAESLIGNNNSLYSVGVLDEMREALVDDYGQDDWVSWAEAAGLAVVPSFFRTLKSFAKVSSMKLLKMRDAYYGLDVTDDMDEIVKATDEFIRNFNPSGDGHNVLTVVKEKAPDGSYNLIRMGNSRLGNVTNAVSPRTLAGVMRASSERGSTNKTLKALGFDEESTTLSTTVKTANEAGEGVNPRVILGEQTVPTTSEIAGRKSAVELFQERPLGLVLSADEIQSAGKARFARIDTLTGESSSLHIDKTDLVSDESGFTMVGRFGATDTEGYTSFDEAALAAESLVGETFEIVAKKPNESLFFSVQEATDAPLEYFIQIPVKREFSPTDGVQFLDGSTYSSPDGLVRVFGTHSDRISKGIINDFSLLKDFNTAVADRLQKTLKPYASTSGAERGVVNTLLDMGDKRQATFNISEASELVGKPLTRESRIWKAYQSARQYYDDIADINDMRVRAELSKRNFKDVNVRDEYGNKVWGQPLTYDELFASGAQKVYDVDLKRAVNLDEIVVDDSVVPVRLKNSVQMDGELFTLVLRSIDKVGELPQRVNPRRGGYVNLAYKDVGALVKLRTSRTVNGIVDPEGGQEVLRFAESVEEAERWLNKTPAGGTKTNRELLLEGTDEGSEIITSESREALFELASLEAKPSGNVVPYNLRGRKDQPVETVRGSVEVLEIDERINKSLRSMENTLNRDSLQVLKQRFMSQFGGFLQDSTRFPESPRLDGKYRVNASGVVPDEATRKNMANIHNYIVDMERLMGFRSDSRLDQAVQSVLKSMKLGQGVGNINVIDDAKKVASFMVIYGRPMFQILANTSQMLSFSARDPIRGTASIMETAIAAPAIALRKTGRNVDWDLYAKFAGFPSGKDLTKWIDSLETSGVFSAARLDNLLSNFDSARRIESRNKFKRGASLSIDAPRLAQAMGTDLTNLVAYRHAVKLAQEQFPGTDVYSKAGLKNVHNLFRELTFNMNKTDAVISETSNVLSLPLLWTQHVYKGWKQMVAKPLGKTLTGKDFGKNPSLWADTYPQAVLTTGMNLLMFGGAGLIGSEWILDLDEQARKKGIIQGDESLGYFFYEGLIDMMMKDALGVDINSAERISFGDAPQMMLSLTNLDEGALNIFGGTAIAFTRIGQFMETLHILNNTPEATEEDMFELMKFIGEEGLSIFTGFSDYEKAELAKNFGIYFSSGGNPLYRVDPEQEIGALFSFRPDDAGLRERILFDGKGSPDEANFYTKTIPQTFSRWFWSRMNDLEEKGQLTFTAYSGEMEKFYKYIDAATGNTGAKHLSGQAKRAFTNLAIDPTGLFTDAKLNAKNRSMVKGIMDNYSHNEAKAKLEQVISLADDENLRSQAKTMLDVLNLQQQLLGGNDG